MGLKPRGVHRANPYRRVLAYTVLHTLALVWSCAETERGDYRNTWLIIASLVLLWTWASLLCLLGLELQALRATRRRMRYVREMGQYMAQVARVAQGDVEEIFAMGWAGELIPPGGLE